MKRKNREPGSFRAGLTLATLLCWILPIFIVVSVAGYLLNENFTSSIRRTVDLDVNNALQVTGVRMLAVIEDSKAVSYDGVVRNAYRDYCLGGVAFNVYRSTSDYLQQRFSRSPYCKSVFIHFLDEELDILPYMVAPGTAKLQLLREYESEILPATQELIGDKDTGIYFLSCEKELYMVRNLLDSNFKPYAMLIIGLDQEELLPSMYGISELESVEVFIDGVAVHLKDMPENTPYGHAEQLEYAHQVDGHTIRCTGQLQRFDISGRVPMLRWVVLLISLLVIPLLLLIIWLFYRNVNHPIEVLIDANSRVQAGERGFEITDLPPNTEFKQLYAHFNSMSGELNSQFRRLYEEQQALQQAKIKALQSQINPHFLNNTLEVINWEARLADNERVSSMIEALSTMLDAAIGRDGRSQVLLSEEMKYVEAYLYITQERLGDRLTVTREVEPEVLDQQIPLLLIQPILENAVEHDLSRNGGELCLRAFFKGNDLYLEVEHDGNISAEGWENIRKSIQSGAEPEGRRSVGLRNVSNRLALLYGEKQQFDIFEVRPGRVLAQIILTGARTTTANN
ncbi:MAG: histidine kinase [Oscillospiraceae bacterium]|nr:histidine kinase [Oscillospiraceae bacterium]